MVILPISTFVFAQDSEEEEVEEVVVTGYKSSLKDAIDIKRKINGKKIKSVEVLVKLED